MTSERTEGLTASSSCTVPCHHRIIHDVQLALAAQVSKSNQRTNGQVVLDHQDFRLTRFILNSNWTHVRENKLVVQWIWFSLHPNGFFIQMHRKFNMLLAILAGLSVERLKEMRVQQGPCASTGASGGIALAFNRCRVCERII